MKRQFAKYAVLSCVVAGFWALACSPDAPGIFPPPPPSFPPPPPPPTSPPGYDVIDLGTLGGESARPYALNDSGQVVGTSTTASGESHAFFWKDGVMHDLAGPFAESRAETITNSGLVAGVGRKTVDGAPSVFQWSNGVTTDLGTVRPLGGGQEDEVRVIALTGTDVVAWRQSQMNRYTSAIWHNGVRQVLPGLIASWNGDGDVQAIAMNNRRQIVGSNLMPGAAVQDVYHAFMWEDGVTRDLGVLSEFACIDRPELNCGEASAVDINNSSQVIGWSRDTARSPHAVLWADGSIRDLGAWSPVAINEAGDIAGYGVRESDATGYFWRNGTLTTIGSLGGATYVVDMNDQSTVVGTSLTAAGKPHAFVWKPGQSQPTDLGAGPSGSPGVGIGTVAVAINARGDILGYTCANYLAGWCALLGTDRAILWRVKP